MEDNIRYVRKLLEDPTLTQTEEFKRWIQDKEHYDLFWNTKAALDDLLLKEKRLPELQEEWDRFQKAVTHSDSSGQHLRVRKLRFKRFLRWGAAAIFGLVLGYGIYSYIQATYFSSKIVLVHALPFPQNITVINNAGDTFLLYKKDTVYNSIKRRPYRTAYNIVRTPRGKDFRITLSDGTEVLLNSESSLHYPECFAGKERVVELKGEAYFKVAKNASAPFIVKTDYVQTKVLGTDFNIKAYPHADPHVTLVEGSIAVKRNDDGAEVTLHPGEDVSVAEGMAALDVQVVDIRKHVAWTNGYFFFEDTSLEEIMRQLGTWYNVNVEFADSRAMAYHFNFWVNRNNSIREAIELLRQVNKVKIILEGNTITIF